MLVESKHGDVAWRRTLNQMFLFPAHAMWAQEPYVYVMLSEEPATAQTHQHMRAVNQSCISRHTHDLQQPPQAVIHSKYRFYAKHISSTLKAAHVHYMHNRVPEAFISTNLQKHHKEQRAHACLQASYRESPLAEVQHVHRRQSGGFGTFADAATSPRINASLPD